MSESLDDRDVRATSVLDYPGPQRLGTSSPTVSIKPPVGRAGFRALTVDGNAAFKMSEWCGTCPFVFERLEGSSRTLSIDALTERLDAGMDRVDPSVVEAVAALLPEADYLPLLLDIRPRLVVPGGDGDYFSEEQVAAWGESALGSEGPRTPYYRTVTRAVGEAEGLGVVVDDARLYEFVVPMVPPSWNDRDRVEDYAKRLRSSSEPTAVALGVLDIVKRPWRIQAGGGVHWGLAHYLLDGHHKVEAAAQVGASVRLLSLVSVDGSSTDFRREVERLPSILETAPVDEDPIEVDLRPSRRRAWWRKG